jgi:predicted methyltransferase
MGPLLTLPLVTRMRAALGAGETTLACSMDLNRSSGTVALQADAWTWRGRSFPYPPRLKERTIYHWTGEEFAAAARYSAALIKLVPTDWGPPTFEIDGIKMLPSAQISPYEDAERKVGLIEPRGKAILDTCAGLGYFAAWCLAGGAHGIVSFEKNPDVLWLRSLNPWSPAADPRLALIETDAVAAVAAIDAASVDAVLHDPPRFGIAGELYSLAFYAQLARVLRRRGRLFHYTGTPNKLTSRRDVPREVATRLGQAGFSTEYRNDGILAIRR